MITFLVLFIAASFCLGGLAMYLASKKTDAVTRRNRWIKFIGYFVVVNLVLVSAWLGKSFFLFLIVIIVLVGLYELISVSSRSGFSIQRLPLKLASIIVYAVLSYGLVVFAQAYTAAAIIFVYIVVASLDGFSQIIGQLIGKHPLVPAISPGKTVEGALGGLAAAVIAAVVLRPLVNMAIPQAVLAALLLGISGMAGDLAASWLKRIYGVKDFGKILPQHGGILDRFDSLFTAAPVFVVFDHFIHLIKEYTEIQNNF